MKKEYNSANLDRVHNRNKNLSNLQNYLLEKKTIEDKKKNNKKSFIELKEKLEKEKISLLLQSENIKLENNKKLNFLKQQKKDNKISKDNYFQNLNLLDEEFNNLYKSNQNNLTINKNKINNIVNNLDLIEKSSNLYKSIFVSKIDNINYDINLQIKILIKK